MTYLQAKDSAPISPHFSNKKPKPIIQNGPVLRPVPPRAPPAQASRHGFPLHPGPRFHPTSGTGNTAPPPPLVSPYRRSREHRPAPLRPGPRFLPSRQCRGAPLRPTQFPVGRRAPPRRPGHSIAVCSEHRQRAVLPAHCLRPPPPRPCRATLRAWPFSKNPTHNSGPVSPSGRHGGRDRHATRHWRIFPPLCTTAIDLAFCRTGACRGQVWTGSGGAMWSTVGRGGVRPPSKFG